MPAVSRLKTRVYSSASSSASELHRILTEAGIGEIELSEVRAAAKQAEQAAASLHRLAGIIELELDNQRAVKG